MQHRRRSTLLGLRQPSKQVFTALRTCARLEKYRLCMASRRANFQTRSMGVNCGLYGGKNNSVSTRRYLKQKRRQHDRVVVPRVVQYDHQTFAAWPMPQQLAQKRREGLGVEYGTVGPDEASRAHVDRTEASNRLSRRCVQ